MPQHSYSKKIIKRALDEDEFEKFDKEYKKHRNEFSRGWVPSEKTWELWEKNPHLSHEQWKEHWGLKSEQAVIRRLGRMYLIEGKKQRKEVIK